MLPFTDEQVEVVEIMGASSLPPIDLLLFLLVPLVRCSELGHVLLRRFDTEMVFTSSLNRPVLLLDEWAVVYIACHFFNLDALSFLRRCILTFLVLPLDALRRDRACVTLRLWSFVHHC